MEDEERILDGGEKLAPALIAVHPQCAALVVAIGAGLRIFDLKKLAPAAVTDGTAPGRHAEAVKAVAFNKEGNLFASAGDDKLVKLWDTETWSCIKTTRLAKKVTVVCFTEDSKWLLFADKFGVVFALPTCATAKTTEPVQLLAHCCSIITDMALAPDGKYIVTSDRDFKIRVSVLPSCLASGAHEIWSYCLGHTSFVTCVAFVGDQSHPQHLLVSGSGDATVETLVTFKADAATYIQVRLWDCNTGHLLDTVNTNDVVSKAVLTELAEVEENPRAVIGVSVSPAGSDVAVIVERYAGVLVLEYDGEHKKLNYLQTVALAASPTSVAFDSHGRLWSVAGAAETVDSSDRAVSPEEAAAAEAKAHATAVAARAHVELIKFCVPSAKVAPQEGVGELAARPGNGSAYEVCPVADALPEGAALLRVLHGNSVDEAYSEAAEGVAEAAVAAELAMKNLMTKRQYSVEERESRKRLRNDKNKVK